MLGNLIKAFVAANLVSQGSSMVLGEENPLTKGLKSITSGSFLSSSGSSSVANMDFKSRATMNTDVDSNQDIKLAGASTNPIQPNLSGPSQVANLFPMGTRNEVKVSPEIRRFLNDLANDKVEQNINIDINKLYNMQENRIEVT